MRGPRPHPGRVVQIRVSPRDCMACVDLVKKLEPDKPWGALPPGSSFAQLVSFSLRVLCESARLSAVVPTREGFEFSELMEQWPDTPGSRSQARKVDISRTIERAIGEDGRVPGVQQMPRGAPMSAEQRRATTRMHELFFKQEHAPDSWTPEDDAELSRVIAVASGDPVPKGTP